MFKKAGDNVHYLARIGSHSTKGTRTGVVHGPSSEDFTSKENIALRVQRIRELSKQEANLRGTIRGAQAVFKEALASGDKMTVAGLAPVIRRVLKNITALAAERRELKLCTPETMPDVRVFMAAEAKRAAKKIAKKERLARIRREASIRKRAKKRARLALGLT